MSDKIPGAKGPNTEQQDQPQGPFPLSQADEERLGQLFEEWSELAAEARQKYAQGKPTALMSEAEVVNLRNLLEKMVAELKRGGDTT